MTQEEKRYVMAQTEHLRMALARNERDYKKILMEIDDLENKVKQAGKRK